MFAFALSSTLLSLIPIVSLAAGGLVVASAIRDAPSLADAAWRAAAVVAPATVISAVVLAAFVVILARLLSIGVKPGIFGVRSRTGWQVWSIERLLDLSRTLLFPLYASLFTPVWLRMLGAKVGRNVEASTV